MTTARSQLLITNYVLRASRHAPLLALILLAIYPILTGGLPSTGDGLNHFYRLAELDWHVRHGDLYPRWFANMHYGYGAPVLNFYAPLSYYLPLLFRIFNLPLALCLQLAYALALALAILGAYLWAGELNAPGMGANKWAEALRLNAHPLVTAAAYGLAPYFYFNIFHRGAYPETWALAIGPWILWAVHRAARRPTLPNHVFISLLVAALILTHTLSAFIFVPVAFIYALALRLLYQPPAPRTLRAGLNALGFWILGFGISAFFILPLLFESQYIQLARAYSTGDLDYRRNFLSLATLLSPPPIYDPHLVFNAMPPSLAWPQLALGLLAVGGSLLALYRNRLSSAAMHRLLPGTLCLLLSIFTLTFAEPLWAAVPFSRFIQFPWRLVGPASLFLAGLAGSGSFRALNLQSPISKFAHVAPVLSIALFFLFSLPWTYHAVFTAPRPFDTIILYEVESGQMGTASNAEYLPVWVEAIPRPVIPPDAGGEELMSRLIQPPGDVEVTLTRGRLNDKEVTFQSPSSFTATFRIFYFPGWGAALDGQPARIDIEKPNGLISVQVPAGRHTLRVSLRPTATQIVGSLISIAALLVTIALAVVGRRETAFNPVQSPDGAQSQSRVTFYALRFTLLTTLIPLALILARAAYLDRVETLFHHTRITALPNPTSVNFDSQLELIGFDYSPQAVSGGRLPVTLYWRAIQPPADDYAVSVQLADRFGNRFGQSDSQHPGGVPTSRWALDQYARDVHDLLSLEGTPPGDYELRITLYSDRPLSILENDAPAGVEYVLGTLAIRRAPAQPPGPLTLVEFDLAADSVQVGDRLAFTAVWDSGDHPAPGLTASVELTAEDGQTLLRESRPPAGPDYASGQWTPNERIRYPISITLPPDLPGGAARVWLSLTDAGGGVAAGPFELGSILVTVPERSFEIPPLQARVDRDFAGAIRLLGYAFGDESITLYWQCLKPVSASLTVFVHTLDEDGKFSAGHDAAPARATTGWLPGEVIADVHPIRIADRFEVGLYDPISDARFGETFVTRR